MRKITLLLVLYCLVPRAFGQAQTEPDFLQISILTCAPGEELYAKFGHSAVRVKDQQKGTDIVFNYGVVNFAMPYFYFKFARGQMDYMLVAEPFERFTYSYIHENRGILEQVLDLTPEQKINIYKFLINNSLPENRIYRYDFLRDNCATRPRDVILKFAGEVLELPRHLEGEGKSFRELIETYLQYNPWLRFSINLGMGAPADALPDLKELCFLPDYLARYLDKTQIKNQKKPLVKTQNMIFTPQPEPEKTKPFITPLSVNLGFLMIVILLSIMEWRRKTHFLLFDKTFFLLCGLAGLFISILWGLTEHTVTVYNANLLWAMPVFVYTAFRLKSKITLPVVYFHLCISFFLAIALVIDLTVYNLFDSAVIPLAAVVLLRSFLLWFRK